MVIDYDSDFFFLIQGGILVSRRDTKLTYNERVEEIIRHLRTGSPMHARMDLNHLIRDLGYE